MATLENLMWGDRDDPRRELAELFPGEGDAVSVRARDWARRVVDAAGVPREDELRVIRTLRDAEPRLSLKPARYLAAQLNV
ncbi:hypothetical protein QSU92_10250 [Microbacterium sp. ET2]|uniref:hypothetical protein n=1 Tax=Microbacterium albipurpureum TaxID=3050384 RepID=UPI00259CD763|nr:hypothetical protein [Microbacterium sp. ET2 (Ac-2212)]WJL94369.1 hypothetical protein QSU92_10250 [Microbacterium sp. ET2 (Ac-2212)]